jgi:hypothetical protein
MRYLFPILIIFITGCGVKGKPMPPDEPAFIGNGFPEQSKENQKKKPNEVKANEQQ